MTSTDSLSQTPLAAPGALSPDDGATLDGQAATFRWHPTRGATRYQLQIADDDAFTSLHLDLNVDVSTELTLYSMLPQSGQAFFWRIRAAGPAGTSPWSPVASFHAGRSASPATRKPVVSSPRPHETSAPRPAASGAVSIVEPEPYRTGWTREGEALAVLVMILLTLGITIACILSAAP